MAGRRRARVAVPEIVALLVVTGILAAASVPMYAGYKLKGENKSARYELKVLYLAVEDYYSEKGQLPARPEEAVPDWTSRYSGRYSYLLLAGHKYQFKTREKIGGVYIYTDETGSIAESGT